MEKLTEKEILEIFEKLFGGEYVSNYCLNEVSYSAELNMDSLDDYEEDKENEIEQFLQKIGNATNIYDTSTTSGDAYFILFLEDHGVYVKVQGYYNSYDSCSEYEDATFSIVVPKEKTITVYEKE